MKLRATFAIVALLATTAIAVGTPAPAGAAPETSDRIIAIRGADNAVWIRTLPEGSPVGSLRPWKSLGGVTNSAPVASFNSVIIRGLDNAIWTNEHNSTADTWSGWRSLGGSTTDTPAVSRFGEVFVRGIDGAVYNRVQNGSTPWQALGGSIAGSPATPIAGDALAVRGTDGSVYLSRLTLGGWTGWQALAGSTTDTPAVTTDGSGANVGIRGLDGAVWGRTVPETGSPTAWSTFGGTIVGSPLLALGTVIVGSPGGNGYYFAGGWVALPGRYNGPLAAGDLGVVGRGLDNALYLIPSDQSLMPLGGTTMSAPAISPGSPS